MEIIERNFLTNDWITLTFIVGGILLALMKLFKPQHLLGYAIAFFTQGFIEKKAEENPSIFTPFHAVLFAFSIITISLTGYLILPYFGFQQNFLVFLGILGGTAIYFSVKTGLHQLFAFVLDIEDYTRYFLFTKNGYLYTLCLWLFPVLIVHQYWLKNTSILIVLVLILFAFRGLLILFNNKKIVFHKLFYFILYFCTLELAPLLILYKTITK
ncbi:DUF4271 domain-containing protein [Tenacibaculum sp. IB213877]|uniref:DUF4271 domain-containing protein n=1 Tax=Tenacibaculum sp. IB213877 TaxID=3097351 RepID=UPI002A5985B7|nr:DUF4271 domain-containing protein [Tenacibaculum sp. IB213877]MDY0780528.1 DUF4271 domain-containing protein [Tenacibaculum sp. IB213877]